MWGSAVRGRARMLRRAQSQGSFAGVTVAEAAADVVDESAIRTIEA